MELMKLKEADIIERLDAETFAPWINAAPSSLLSCTEIHMARKTISIHEKLQFLEASISSPAEPSRAPGRRLPVLLHSSSVAEVSTFLLTMPYKHLNSAPGLHASQFWTELHPLLGWVLPPHFQGDLNHSFSAFHQPCVQHNAASGASPGLETHCAQFTHTLNICFYLASVEHFQLKTFNVCSVGKKWLILKKVSKNACLKQSTNSLG